MKPPINRPQTLFRHVFAVLAAIVLTCGSASAIVASLNGTYSAGSGTQVIVSGGEATSNSVLNQHQSFTDTFISTTNGLLVGGIRVTYSFTESAGGSTFTVNYFADGQLVLTFTSTMSVTVLSNTDNSFRSRTEWTMEMSSSVLGNVPLSSLVVTETFTFNASNFTCNYSDGSVNLILRRTNTGTGLGQGSPIIPVVVNWQATTVLSFPIVNPVGTVWLDPPFATSFQYDLAPGRKERIAKVTLPKGFGNKIKVLAKKSSKAKPTLVGTFKSGAKIDLLKKPGFSGGAYSVIVQGIKPKVDLKKRAPYPLGLAFTGLKESSAKVKVTPKNVTR